MRVSIAAIGKFKSGPHVSLFEHYAARCSWKITLKEWECKKQVTGAVLQQQEAEWLLAATKDADYRIALHERGSDLSSAEFAARLSRVRDNGARHIAFIIGGADGLHASVLAQTNLALSFGRVTWPHLLVRGLLAEQLYRAESILAGHPYHRE